MNFGSACSGIEAASVAWGPLKWKPVFFAEIDKFPSAVLAHHYPDVPNAGDFTAIQQGDYDAIDALVAGTPCQDFSVAGLRAGMDGKRGQLTVEYAHLAHRLGPRWLVWENVTGVLSIDNGEAFATFLGLLCGHTVRVPRDGWQNSGVIAGAPGSYGLAYRVLDAQYCGVPQRRRRVFVVGYLGDWRRAAAVLFERQSMSGYPAPSREAGKRVAGSLSARPEGGGGLGTDFECDGGGVVAQTLTSGGTGARGHLDPVNTTLISVASTGDIAHCLHAGGMGRQDYETETVIVTAPLTRNPYADHESRESLLVTHSLRADGFDASEDGTGRGTPIVPVAIQAGATRENSDSGPDGVGIRADGIAYTLEARSEVQVVAFDTTQITSPNCRSNPKPGDPCHTLSSGSHAPAIAFRAAGQDGFSASEISPPITSTDGGGAGVPTIGFYANDSGDDAGINLSPTLRAMDGGGGNHPAVTYPIADMATRCEGTDGSGNFNGKGHGLGIGEPDDPMFTLTKGDKHAVAVNLRGRDGGAMPELDEFASLWAASGGSSRSYVLPPQMAVRRLTARECERLQGFPDDYTLIPMTRNVVSDKKLDADYVKYMQRTARIRFSDGRIIEGEILTREQCRKLAADGPRYKALGNSMAVPVMRWIGERIDMVEQIVREA